MRFAECYCVKTLLQEDLPDLLISNHDAFFVKLNLPPPLPAAASAATSLTPTVAPLTSPKLGSKKAPSKVLPVGSPLSSPLSTPMLKAVAAAASEETAAVADLKPEITISEGAAESEDAASPIDTLGQCHFPSSAYSDIVPPSVEAQD